MDVVVIKEEEGAVLSLSFLYKRDGVASDQTGRDNGGGGGMGVLPVLLLLLLLLLLLRCRLVEAAVVSLLLPTDCEKVSVGVQRCLLLDQSALPTHPYPVDPRKTNNKKKFNCESMVSAAISDH